MISLRYTVPAMAAVLSFQPAVTALADEVIDSKAGPLKIETVVDGLDHPWSLAFLPEGGMLITERPGALRYLSPEGALSAPIAGVPEVMAEGQGGLLDVALHPDFAKNRLVYLSFSEAAADGTNGTAVARGRLSDDRSALTDVAVIFRQEPKVGSRLHFGSRLAFDRDGHLFVSLGERSSPEFRVLAQDLGTLLGKVVRLADDGSPAPGNPFAGTAGARPEIWSYGHRNPQGLALNPVTGVVWEHEHGPKGGDEVQPLAAGANYGWPVFSYGTEYSGRKITDAKEHPAGFTGPAHFWVPSIAPSGMAFYASDAVPEWTGDLFVGALAGQMLVRLDLDGDTVVGEERLDMNRRIRDVRVGPDGALWLLTDEDDGELLRIVKAGPATD